MVTRRERGGDEEEGGGGERRDRKKSYQSVVTQGDQHRGLREHLRRTLILAGVRVSEKSSVWRSGVHSGTIHRSALRDKNRPNGV